MGATFGMALVLRGGHAVIWSQHIDTFPYVKGMLPVFLSWIVSPIAAGDSHPIMHSLTACLLCKPQSCNCAGQSL